MVNSLASIAKSLNVSDISSEVLDVPFFALCSGSSKESQHHYGDGGLAIHTQEVFDLCDLSNRYLGNPVDRASIFLACLFHDCGKMWDCEKIDEKWTSNQHKRRIHHISRSAIVWSRSVDKYPKYRYLEDDVLHAILSHHGHREFGSPVVPNTKLAWLLHLNDGISARINDADKFDRIH